MIASECLLSLLWAHFKLYFSHIHTHTNIHTRTSYLQYCFHQIRQTFTFYVKRTPTYVLTQTEIAWLTSTNIRERRNKQNEFEKNT